MLEIVIQRMPYLREAFVAAFGMQVDDVNCGNTRYLIHRDVVIADHRTQFISEIGSIA